MRLGLKLQCPKSSWAPFSNAMMMKLSKIVELKNFASMLQNQFACRKFADFSGFQMVLKTPAHCSSH